MCLYLSTVVITATIIYLLLHGNLTQMNDEADVLPALKAKQCPIGVVTRVNQDMLHVMPDHMHCNVDVAYFKIAKQIFATNSLALFVMQNYSSECCILLN